MAGLPIVMLAAAASGVRNSAARKRVLGLTMRSALARVQNRSLTIASKMGSASRAQPSALGLARRMPPMGVRTFTSSRIHHNVSTPETETAVEANVLADYEGPLARTFTRLKLFSLGSLGMASVLTPVLLLAPGEISLAGRVGLCITALATSGVSTALIAWIGTPYVGTMRLLSRKSAHDRVVMELNTVSWRLQPQRTVVYEPTFLRPTSRPFAAWEITNNPPPLTLPPDHDQVVKKIAETFDVKTGKSLGWWQVKYSASTQTNAVQDGQFKAQGVVSLTGKPTRYFNVHEELLNQDWQVLG